ncbi:adenosylmethionine--8-amino-7-oxononanoate transaminase [Shewanella glacialipiscicola]|uniref:Adenosylmethionine-8-amino-7-oxononanoate aminotransferase n=1 Tax=Shewanella glacialipiscicola TaxID=614069 RepID=A0ABQ6J8Q5_9GAMM|nr:adenosylmethionine--8-amino-7-oxononanoate transaminase [Shewanella glacialipiscicola]MCL1087783.1 adenosylmethionine--8-amino-7-oxononanoate transaminase [Shewanella glacialipiscicola]GIU06547.1 adenosylmethionine--8-amino-7-oxononanoate aminotransferase BioA [Shewanella glacialipiscicola]GMA81676.1 adenosylmethionine--8-amino-7-oxononanoate aminotransferase BioA [Shewanella glacialipiscicola]GMA84548.1 adenosylmethionine--8-amino-7-oxononanoate aminotransferase BioA [Shewanella glacialipis
MRNLLDFDFDSAHIWHPYTSMTRSLPVYGVHSAKGCELELVDGRKLIDGTSSWWACVHGYAHPEILTAMEKQLHQLSHVMFGGITHEPAIELCKKLIAMTCEPLTKVFLCDSGSIAVEVAIKMALQYWQGQNAHEGLRPLKQRILTVKKGYHGDTFAAMSVCDPEGGMHTMFGDAVTKQSFVPAPQTAFGETLQADDLTAMRSILSAHNNDIAAVIIEPIMQGAGGMRFYSADYLIGLRALCDEFNVLLILDEIATGFGRTGKLFAYEHANITPDILCLGKALTGGYISLAATLCTDNVAQGISQSPAGVFMHGPTFMGNPLACAAACASLDLINRNQWQAQVAAIEQQMRLELKDAIDLPSVKDVRVLGAVGVLEMYEPVNTAELQQQFVDLGVWVRPFANLIYIMPPYVISSAQLSQLTGAMKLIAAGISASSTHSAPQLISHG